MINYNAPVYQVSLFNPSSWGGWVTCLETNSHSEAENKQASLNAQGYETSLWPLDKATLSQRLINA